MIDCVSQDVIAGIARDVFGGDARIRSAEKLTSAVEHGVARRAGSTRSLVYVVALSGMPERYVFRFHRGAGEDRYEQEVRNYRLLTEKTGIPVPEVYRVDRSRRLAPTAFMIMQYGEGDPWQYLAHPATPETGPEEKAQIQREVGRWFARVHQITRPVERSEQSALPVYWMLDRLENAVRNGHISVEPAKIDLCRRAVEREPHLRSDVLSLCLADTEFFFRRAGARWEFSFGCDVEWIEFRDRYSDLVPVLAGPTPLWQLDDPLLADPGEAATLPFFQGYESILPVDYERLARLTAYEHLGVWCYLANEPSTPEKKRWIRRCKEPLIVRLVDRVAANAPPDA